MPRLVIFTRRIDMAPDDLYLPAGTFAIFRVVWMICLIITLNALVNDSCDIIKTLGLYVCLHLGVCLVAVVIEIWIAILSSRAKVNSQQYGQIDKLSQYGVISHVVDWLLQFYGFSVAVQPIDLICTADKIPVSIGVVQMIVIWAFISNTLFFIVLFVFFYISRPGNRGKSDAKEILLLWKRRIEWLLSSPEKVERKGDGQKAITQVATVFARFFKDVDWAPSDVAVGLILLKREQKIMRAVTELRKTFPIRSSFWENLFHGNSSPVMSTEKFSDSDYGEDSSPGVVGGRIPRLRSPSLRSHYTPQSYHVNLPPGTSYTVKELKDPSQPREPAVVAVDIARKYQDVITVTVDGKQVVDEDVNVNTKDVVDLVDKLDTVKEDRVMESIDAMKPTITVDGKQVVDEDVNVTTKDVVDLVDKLDTVKEDIVMESIDAIKPTIAVYGKQVVDVDFNMTTKDVVDLVDKLDTVKEEKVLDSPDVTKPVNQIKPVESVDEITAIDKESGSMITQPIIPQNDIHKHSVSTLKDDDLIEPLPAAAPKRKSMFASMLDFSMISSAFFEDKSSNISNNLRKPVSTDLARKSEDVYSRAPNRELFKSRSMSFSLGVTNRLAMKSKDETVNNSWNFANYSFNLDPNSKDLKRSDILDVLHFSHYAYMAYVKLDLEIHKKTDILLHYSPLNDLYQSPFLVSVDHDWNTIVIAIRGTYSASDILVDLNLETEILDEDLEYPEKYKVHSGFYKTARNIVKDIMNTQVLEKTLKGEAIRESSYHIVVCGHSLGAGIAALVAYLLIKEGYARTTCYGYSMPSLANEAAAELFNEFCLSVVNGDDIVSRLSLHSCEVLKRDVARLLKNCNLPKYRVFGSALHNQFSCFGSTESRKSLLQRTQNGSIPDGTDTELQESEIEKILSQTGSLPKRWRAGLTGPQLQTASTSRHVCLYVPGRILYIEKLRILEPQQLPIPVSSQTQGRKRGVESLQKFRQAMSDAKHKLEIAKHKSFDSKYIYTPRWASKHEFTEIIVSRTMIRDHLSVFGIMKEFDSVEFDTNPLKVMS